MKRKLSPWCKEVKKTLIDRDMSVTELCGEVLLLLSLHCPKSRQQRQEYSLECSLLMNHHSLMMRVHRLM